MFFLLIQSLLTVGRLTKCWIAAFLTRRELTPYLLYHLFTSYQCTGEKLQRGVGKLPEFAVVFNCLNASNMKCRLASPWCSELKLLCVASPFQLAQLFWWSASPCTLPEVAEGTWALLARLQWGHTFPTHLSTVLCTETRKNPTSSSGDTRIKDGEESYFTIAVLVISSVQKKPWSAECLAVVAVLEGEFINELLV